MRVELILGNDGSAAISVANGEAGSFEEARAKLERVKALLGDLPIEFAGEVERHVHGPDGQHVHTHQHAH